VIAPSRYLFDWVCSIFHFYYYFDDKIAAHFTLRFTYKLSTVSKVVDYLDFLFGAYLVNLDIRQGPLPFPHLAPGLFVEVSER